MNKQWCVYILECRDKTLYTGMTNDLSHRLDAHNSGKGAKYTKGRVPVTLRYHEICESKSAALQREFQIKQLSRTEKETLCKTYDAGE